MNMFGPRQVAPAPEIGWVGRSQILGDCAGSPGGRQGLGLLPDGRELQCDSGVAPFDLARSSASAGASFARSSNRARARWCIASESFIESSCLVSSPTS